MAVVKYLTFGIMLLACSCSSKVSQTTTENRSQYKIEKLKASEYHTIIAVNVYDSKKERSILSGILVNGVIFMAKNGSSSIKIIQGSYEFIVRSIGYQDAIVKNLFIESKDSVHIEVLIAEDHQPLH